MTDSRLAGLQQSVPGLRLKTDPADLEHYGRDWTRWIYRATRRCRANRCDWPYRRYRSDGRNRPNRS